MSSRLSEARARQALRASRLPYRGRLERASSTRNETYLSDRHVVRINGEANQRLRREAQLYPHLPQGPWAPTKVAVGGEVGADYLIIERRPGAPLAHHWPDLGPDQRRRAVRTLAAHLKAIHATRTPPGIGHLEHTPHLLDHAAAPPVRPLLEGLDRLATDPHADAGIVAAVRDYVVANWAHLDPFDTGHLIHGDLTFENVLWDGRDVSAVIDFEWCRGAPPDLDLDVLLRCCALPQAHVADAVQARTRPQDYEDVVWWLAEAYPRLFAHPRLFERLMLYALSFEVKLTIASPLPDHRPDDPDSHPYSRLVGLISTGGHVATALTRAGVTT
jgi:aminoglycoside phosphotransferase (APT) family kinase protein